MTAKKEIKCVTITKEQNNWIDEQSRQFKLSQFLQHHLDKYIQMRKDYKEFEERGEDGKEN